METGWAVVSHSRSGSTLCHFILNLKLIIFLRPETLNYTQNDFSSLLLSAVLSDLTRGIKILSDICCQTQPFKQWHLSFITTIHISVPIGGNVQSTQANMWQESHLYIRWNNLNDEKASPVPPLSNCLPQQHVYLQKMFGKSHLRLRPESLHALGWGWGFASQNASDARGSVRKAPQ